MAKQNEYDTKRKKTLKWGYLFSVVAFLVFIVFFGRIVLLQNTNVEEIKNDYINKNYRESTLKAARGNLYAADGSILATTVMRYDVYIDFKIIRDSVYKKNINALTDSLSRMFGKPKRYFKNRFDLQRRKKNQYYTLVKGLDFDQYERIRNFPIFRKGRNKGGFIIDRNYQREIATTDIGVGTVGIDDGVFKSGLEAAFSKYLTGKDGKRLEQRVNSTQWKPIDYWNIEEPVDGLDVYTTLDIRIQDIATSALRKQLIDYDARHGSVIVIETKTGKVRAMVNLKKTAPGTYADLYNFALKDGVEQGSTFKVVSLLAAMDDGYIDEKTTVNVGNGVWEYNGQRITDDHGGGTYDISDVLAKSSNIGTAKLITEHYEKKPEIFIDHLRRWKMFEKWKIELSGMAKPIIMTPKNKKWNKATLASISYGYSTNFSLLQLSTFYNGIANGGEMLKPLFIDKIMREKKVIYEAKSEILVENMASKKAIRMMTEALAKAVERGTARSIFTPNLKMAGKTGTTKVEYWLPGATKYRASFGGFFPANDPKYTCFVSVEQPNIHKGYYGGGVAAPVFKEIAGKIFLKTPQNIEKDLLTAKNTNPEKVTRVNTIKEIKNNKMPDITDQIGKEIIPNLENLGYRVRYKGVGRVKEQFPLEGTLLKKNQRIYLSLQE
ncbi:MAG: peptidoglycan glycosyltransferase [Bergeyella sp.]|nr:peptidoglycan glycosyltransferase [Bergeyella sp.]